MAKTKTYRVTGLVTISITTEVKAESAFEAKEKARERPLQTLCHHCASAENDEQWATTGELDGEPKIQEVIVED